MRTHSTQRWRSALTKRLCAFGVDWRTVMPWFMSASRVAGSAVAVRTSSPIRTQSTTKTALRHLAARQGQVHSWLDYAQTRWPPRSMPVHTRHAPSSRRRGSALAVAHEVDRRMGSGGSRPGSLPCCWWISGGRNGLAKHDLQLKPNSSSFSTESAKTGRWGALVWKRKEKAGPKRSAADS